jgi:hypothetical protein
MASYLNPKNYLVLRPSNPTNNSFHMNVDTMTEELDGSSLYPIIEFKGRVPVGAPMYLNPNNWEGLTECEINGNIFNGHMIEFSINNGINNSHFYDVTIRIVNVRFNNQQYISPKPHNRHKRYTTCKCWQCKKFFKDRDGVQFAHCPHCGVDELDSFTSFTMPQIGPRYVK